VRLSSAGGNRSLDLLPRSRSFAIQKTNDVPDQKLWSMTAADGWSTQLVTRSADFARSLEARGARRLPKLPVSPSPTENEEEEDKSAWLEWRPRDAKKPLIADVLREALPGLASAEVEVSLPFAEEPWGGEIDDQWKLTGLGSATLPGSRLHVHRRLDGNDLELLTRLPAWLQRS